MSRPSTPWLIAAVALAAVVAALFAEPMPRAATRDPAAATGDAETDAASAALDARRIEVLARIAYKEDLINRLVAGQTTLDEVTAEFMKLNRGGPVLDSIRTQYPGSSDEEKTAHNVLEYVRQRRLPADQNARVMARLRQEFERRYGGRPNAAE
jgi:hypothetical protein